MEPSGHSLEDQFREFGRGLDGAHPPALHDLPGDGSCPALLPVLTKDPLEITFLEVVHEIAGTARGSRVEPHVEGPRPLEAEAPFRSINLVGRQAEIEDHSVDSLDAGPFQDRIEIREVRTDSLKVGIGPQSLAGCCKSGRIQVDSQDPPAGTDSLQDGLGEAPATQVRIDIDPSPPGIQQFQKLLKENRSVLIALHVSSVTKIVCEIPLGLPLSALEDLSIPQLGV